MSDHLTVKVDPSAIILSLGIAFIGAYNGITLYEQFRLCSKENQPKLLPPKSLLFLMALSLGGVAIWCMHFVGMSAMTYYDSDGAEVPISFRIDLTVVSLIIVVLVVYIGLLLSASDKAFTDDIADKVEKFIQELKHKSIQEIRGMRHKNYFIIECLIKRLYPLIGGGVITATGVCVMHYIGMEAMVFDGVIEWDKGIVAASVIIALVAATAAYWILFRLLSLFPYVELLRVACAVIMSVAVNGMHYTGMAAARYHHLPGHAHELMQHHPTVSQKTATLNSINAAMIFLFIGFILAISDLRMWFYNLSRIVKEADVRALVAMEDTLTRDEIFLYQYRKLRQFDGSSHSLLQYRDLIKKSPSGSGSLSQTSAAHGTTRATDGRGGGGGGGGASSTHSQAIEPASLHPHPESLLFPITDEESQLAQQQQQQQQQQQFISPTPISGPPLSLLDQDKALQNKLQQQQDTQQQQQQQPPRGAWNMGLASNQHQKVYDIERAGNQVQPFQQE